MPARNEVLVKLGYVVSALGGLITVAAVSVNTTEARGLLLSFFGVVVAGLGLLLVWWGNRP